MAKTSKPKAADDDVEKEPKHDNEPHTPPVSPSPAETIEQQGIDARTPYPSKEE